MSPRLLHVPQVAPLYLIFRLSLSVKHISRINRSYSITMADFRLLIHSARQIVQVVNNNKLVCKGREMNQLAILEDNNGCSIVVDWFV